MAAVDDLHRFARRAYIKRPKNGDIRVPVMDLSSREPPHAI
jgi:hypothetical protein